MPEGTLRTGVTEAGLAGGTALVTGGSRGIGFAIGRRLSESGMAGRQAFPHNGAYAASKFGVRGLHAVLDAELRGTGVRSTLVEPAATDTALWDTVDAERHPGLPP